MREQGFADFLKVEYPQIEIVSRVESFENPQITYEKTVQLLAEQPNLRGIYITCGGVAQVGRALIETGRANDVRVLCYEDYPEIVELMRQGVVDWTLGGEKDEQGALPGQANHGSACVWQKTRDRPYFYRHPYSGQGMLFIKIFANPADIFFVEIYEDVLANRKIG